MAEDPRQNKFERQLLAMPKEFRDVATWGWTVLKPQIETYAVAHGLPRIDAARMGARLARLVVTQMYGDITRARNAPIISRT
jgi:hypothetical protein